MKKTLLLFTVAALALLSGCFIEGTEGGSLTYTGFNVSDNRLTMRGDLVFVGPNPPQDKYENITFKLYAEDGTLLYREQLGTLDAPSGKVSVSASTSPVPKYVIFDSPDIWDGTTGVDYYVYSQETNHYDVRTTTDRSELPITSDG